MSRAMFHAEPFCPPLSGEVLGDIHYTSGSAYNLQLADRRTVLFHVSSFLAIRIGESDCFQFFYAHHSKPLFFLRRIRYAILSIPINDYRKSASHLDVALTRILKGV